MPFIVYTNCFSAELFVNGVSRGVKAYEFPAQGMTREWGHFERRHAPVTTNDLHLTWELPYDPDAEIIVIGRDMDGNESARRVIRRAGSARALRVTADRETIFNNGRSAVQLEIALLDAEGAVAIDDEREIRLNVEGGTLLGMDNGDAADHSLYRSGSRTTFRGLAYAIIRKDRSPSPLIITVTADGLPDRTVRLPVTGKDAAEETRV